MTGGKSALGGPPPPLPVPWPTCYRWSEQMPRGICCNLRLQIVCFLPVNPLAPCLRKLMRQETTPTVAMRCPTYKVAMLGR